MTLRRRLVLAFVSVAVILAAAFVAVGLRQQAVLNEQLDDQLQALSRNAWRIGQGPALPSRAPMSLLPDGAFIGVIEDASLRTIVADPERAGPRVTRDDLERRATLTTVEPFTAPTRDGGAPMRVTAIRTADGWLVVGLSAERVSAAIRQLVATGVIALASVLAVLGLLFWWVTRLGLRPIGELTEVAEGIALGRLDQRVTVNAPATEAGRLATAFNAMADARQDAEQALRRFVADASHELRTPLTTLRGYTALHQAGGLGDADATDDAMRRISQEAERMGVLVDELLLLAALDERRPLDVERTDISRIARDVASDAQAVQPDRPITVDAPEPVVGPVDHDRMFQAVTALVANALTHTAANVPVIISVRRDASRMTVEVRDLGQGIPPDQLDHVFERFHRGAPGRARGRGGTGLGLSIVKAIAEAHGGRVTAASDEGAVFTITVPAMHKAVPAQAGHARPPRPPSPPEGHADSALDR